MTKRIAISMPDPMFRDMEKARKRVGKHRSAWLQETVAERLAREKRARDIAAYIRGYELYPETEEEIAEAVAALRALPPLDDEEWPEAPR